MSFRRAGMALVALGVGCTVPPRTVTLRIELPAALGLKPAQLLVQPRVAEVSRSAERAVVALALRQGPVVITAPGACPIRLDTRQLAPATIERITLRPLFDAGPRERVVGLSQPFTISARPGCEEAEAAHVTLALTGGAQLAAPRLSPDGRSLTATTLPSPPLRSDVAGVVPVSAAEQRRLRSEITLTVELNGARHQQVLGVSAVARSSGLPNVGLTHPVLLSGRGWQLEQQPETSQARLRRVGDLHELLPDVAGKYRLRDAAGKQLSLLSGRFDHTPLDCGRSDCHVETARSAASSPMTQALASDLGGCHTLEQPECASACHATGEPGTEDGGFEHVAGVLGIPALPGEYEDLPAPLQRLGGVGCLACHGPGAIPEPSARWAILRSDVCAVCHDAPPRYGHLQALQTSRMSRADSDAQARREPACARCHTSWGAIGRAAPPDEQSGFGLTCATCHAVHPAGAARPTSGHGLLRDFPFPATLPAPPPSFLGQSRVCISCHAASSSQQPPEASASLLVAGAGGLDPLSGNVLSLPSPHAASARGCLSCHDSGPEELVLGRSHGFRATRTACARCHSSEQQRDPAIAARARSLLARWAGSTPPESAARPPHARPPVSASTSEQQRALYNVLLVLEDPAADVHHPAYAKLLLDTAERFAPGGSP